MPVDPETGLYSPNAGIYPGGGLSGAASAISNIDAGQIAQQERQKRQLAMLLQQLQGQRAQGDIEETNLKNRQLSSELEGQQSLQGWMGQPENARASFDEIQKQAIGRGAVGGPQISTMSWRGNNAETKGFGEKLKGAYDFMRTGMPVDMAFQASGLDDKSILDAGNDPAKVKTVAQTMMATNEAKAKELGARAGLEQQKTANLAAIGPEEVRDLQSKQMLRSAQAAFYKARSLLANADQSLRGKKMAIEAKRLAAPYSQIAGRLRAQKTYTPEEADILEKKAQAVEAEGQKIVQEAEGIIGQSDEMPTGHSSGGGPPPGAKIIDLTGK